MSVNCFITTDYKRPYFLSLTCAAFEFAGYRAQLIQKPMLERYLECERLATTDLYIISDDDIIPGTQDSIAKLVELMEAHPELSQLGMSWKQDLKEEEISGWVRGTISPDILELDHVGGIMCIRKGTVKDFGERPTYPLGDGDDRIMARAARQLGYKVGLAKNIFFHHLGANMSTFLNK